MNVKDLLLVRKYLKKAQQEKLTLTKLLSQIEQDIFSLLEEEEKVPDLPKKVASVEVPEIEPIPIPPSVEEPEPIQVFEPENEVIEIDFTLYEEEEEELTEDIIVPPKKPPTEPILVEQLESMMEERSMPEALLGDIMERTRKAKEYIGKYPAKSIKVWALTGNEQDLEQVWT